MRQRQDVRQHRGSKSEMALVARIRGALGWVCCRAVVGSIAGLRRGVCRDLSSSELP